MRSTRTFEPDAATVVAARHFVASTLAAWSVAADDVPLLVSELATNAVLHARSEFTVSIALGAGLLRVEVSDGNSRMPIVAVVPADAYSGRGLMLVQALASAWGVERHTDQGKTVWFEMALHGTAPTPAPAHC